MGFINFVRVVAIIRDLNGLRVLKIDRPADFLSVQSNEAELANKFNITVVQLLLVC